MKGKQWKPRILSYTIGQFSGLLIEVVARTRVEGTWKAYIGIASGIHKELERKRILDQGSPLKEDTARTIFKNFDELPYAK